jgi:DNA-binding NarL/FixJ family response regulator
MTRDQVRVVLVDDQELVRVGFRLILERAGFAVVGEAADGLEAVSVTRQTTPDVVLMDVRMPRMDGIEATRRIVAANPNTRVLALTTFDLDRYVYAAINAGASGFLLKDVPPDDLAHAVKVVARGEAMLAPVLTRRLLARFAASPAPGQLSPPLRDLSQRDLDIMRLVARGLSNAEIGAELHLSLSTVKTYVSKLLTRLHLRDRLQLAVLAYESGLVAAGQ